MKKLATKKVPVLQVSTDKLHAVVGGANSVFVKPCKTKGALDLADESGGQP